MGQVPQLDLHGSGREASIGGVRFRSINCKAPARKAQTSTAAAGPDKWHYRSQQLAGQYWIHTAELGKVSTHHLIQAHRVVPGTRQEAVSPHLVPVQAVHLRGVGQCVTWHDLQEARHSEWHMVPVQAGHLREGRAGLPVHSDCPKRVGRPHHPQDKCTSARSCMTTLGLLLYPQAAQRSAPPSCPLDPPALVLFSTPLTSCVCSSKLRSGLEAGGAARSHTCSQGGQKICKNGC